MSPSAAAAPAPPPRPVARVAGPRGWRAYHLYYHAPLDLPLRGWMAPLCAALVGEGDVAAFYFVRYGLGGPHLRLRLRPRPGRAAAVDARVRHAADAFLARHPSATPLAIEAIHLQNRQILAHDPSEAPSAEWAVADNTLVSAPAGFEVERYGGAELFGASLDLFSLSSLYVLRAAALAGEVTPGARLGEASRAMLRLAWGLAGGVDEMPALVDWAAAGHVGALGAFAARGDEAFERGRDAFCVRVRRELVSLASGAAGDEGSDAPAWLGAAAAGLEREIRSAGAARRWRIAWSHLHMTANRLGLRNPEEVYVGRMLRRALLALAEAEPGFWRDLGDAHREMREAPGPTLRRRTRDALAAFGAEAESA